MSAESPEQLLDAFRAAALSVTKLYKTSASAQAKARTDGYQDCLDDLLSLLDKEGLGHSDGEGRRIRRWIAERLEGRDSASPPTESDDEVDKAEGDKTDTTSSPESRRPNSTPQSGIRTEMAMREHHPPAAAAPVATTTPAAVEVPEIVVPTQETFTFQSQHAYPQDAYLNLANLDLSDSHGGGAPTPVSKPPRTRHGNNARTGSRQASQLGRGAGQKRKINFAEIFDLGSLGSGKDPFGNGGKRSRHA